MYKVCLWFNILNMSCAYLEKLVICTHTYSFREFKKSLIENVHPASKVEVLVIESSTLLLCCCHGGMLSSSDRAFWERKAACLSSYTWILSSLLAVSKSNVKALISALGNSATNKLRYWEESKYLSLDVFHGNQINFSSLSSLCWCSVYGNNIQWFSYLLWK